MEDPDKLWPQSNCVQTKAVPSEFSERLSVKTLTFDLWVFIVAMSSLFQGKTLQSKLQSDANSFEFLVFAVFKNTWAEMSKQMFFSYKVAAS